MNGKLLYDLQCDVLMIAFVGGIALAIFGVATGRYLLAAGGLAMWPMLLVTFKLALSFLPDKTVEDMKEESKKLFGNS